MPTTLTRRSFLGCSALSGTALALAPRLAFATSGSVDHTLVVLSLRGGLDGLSAVVPIEAGYYDRRPTIAVAEEALLPLDRGFGLHPSLAPLHDVWTDGRLSIVPGVGTPTGSRSHFQETDLIELGAGSLGQPRTTGWLGRHLLSRPQAPDGLPGVALSGSLPMSLAGFPAAAAVGNVGSFAVRGFDWRDRDRVHDTLRSLHEQGGDDLLAAQALATLDTIELLEEADPAAIEPGNGAVYPEHHLGRRLRQVGQLVRADVGLEVATVDLGGWDTHGDMGSWDGGRMSGMLAGFASSLRAFLDDVADVIDRVTVVVLSEFGRRVAENDSGGLDHGRGGLLLVAGGGAAGGIHGDWRGLDESVLDRGDVPTITDYRAPLTEVVRDLLGNDRPDQIFPGYTPAPVGAVSVD